MIVLWSLRQHSENLNRRSVASTLAMGVLVMLPPPPLFLRVCGRKIDLLVYLCIIGLWKFGLWSFYVNFIFILFFFVGEGGDFICYRFMSNYPVSLNVDIFIYVLWNFVRYRVKHFALPKYFFLCVFSLQKKVYKSVIKIRKNTSCEVHICMYVRIYNFQGKRNINQFSCQVTLCKSLSTIFPCYFFLPYGSCS